MMKKIAGIYQIRNIVNNKIYIGSSVNIKNRWFCHKSKLRRGIHVNQILQNAWNKYGEENFEFSILETVENVHDVLPLEQEYLDIYSPEYNIAIYVETNQLGRPMTEEHKAKISETKRKNGDSCGEKNGFYGKSHTDEIRKILSELKTGTKHSEETKRKITIAQIGEKSHYAKLTWEKVNEIRLLFESGKYSEAELVRMYNMSQSAINKIVRYKTWRIE